MAILRETYEKIKHLVRSLGSDAWIIAIVVLVALASFGLGRLSVLYAEKGDFEVVYPHQQSASASEALPVGTTAQNGGAYVASKTGAKYHLPWCSGAQRIKNSNKIYFATKAEAEAAGYTPAGNCKGL